MMIMKKEREAESVFTLRDIVQPETLEEAYQSLTSKRNNIILGGCAFLRLGSKPIGTGIDLGKLNLDKITMHEDSIEIGAMVTFRDIETHPYVKEHFGGVLPKALGNIIGVQFRNIVTVGGSVFSKYGFSDFLTALLALDTEVELYNAGRLPLSEFLEMPYKKDILKAIHIRKDNRKAFYHDLRVSASDFPVLNVSVSDKAGDWQIVVGARPQRAKRAVKASGQLSKALAENSNQIDKVDLDYIAEQAATELNFGTNARGSATYRQTVCKALVKRAITEVAACK